MEKSDLYIGLISNVYGKPNEESLSPTELGFQTFNKAKPNNGTLVFIKGESDKGEETKRFIQNIKKLATCKRFDDLKSYAEDSLTLYLYDKHIICTEPFDLADNLNIDSFIISLKPNYLHLNLYHKHYSLDLDILYCCLFLFL